MTIVYGFPSLTYHGGPSGPGLDTPIEFNEHCLDQVRNTICCLPVHTYDAQISSTYSAPTRRKY